jgi:catalase
MATRNRAADGRARNSKNGRGGETHQAASTADQTLTTNLGIPIADNQNSLRI